MTFTTYSWSGSCFYSNSNVGLGDACGSIGINNTVGADVCDTCHVRTISWPRPPILEHPTRTGDHAVVEIKTALKWWLLKVQSRWHRSRVTPSTSWLFRCTITSVWIWFHSHTITPDISRRDLYHAEVPTIDNVVPLQLFDGKCIPYYLSTCLSWPHLPHTLVNTYRCWSDLSFVMVLPSQQQTHVTWYQMSYFGPCFRDKHNNNSGIHIVFGTGVCGYWWIWHRVQCVIRSATTITQ